jgi:hypothetical protein
MDCFVASLLAMTMAYRLDFRFRELFFFLFGTLAPDLRASESPIAIACLRLLTLRPERPLFSVPFLRFFIARLTLLDAFLEYFLAIGISPGCTELIRATGDGSGDATQSAAQAIAGLGQHELRTL